MEPLVRYQLANHLQSVVLELDQDATPISYEEYFPYGSTAYQAMSAEFQAAKKRYRYTGKERDEESGLYYHGARSYAPWLGRWVSADPAGLRDGANGYLYSFNSPVVASDPSGRYGETGHYYTIYALSLAAGHSPEDARKNALYAQIPDQISELDAISVQISEVRSRLSGSTQRSTAAKRDSVQRVLHALTGGSSKHETGRTVAALQKSKAGTVRYGLLLHRLGDSFSHRTMKDESRMYDTGYGHALDGQAPDQISTRPKLYIEYAKTLFRELRRSALDEGPLIKRVDDAGAEALILRVAGTMVQDAINGGHSINHRRTDLAQKSILIDYIDQKGGGAPFGPAGGDVYTLPELRSKTRRRCAIRRYDRACIYVNCSGTG